MASADSGPSGRDGRSSRQLFFAMFPSIMLPMALAVMDQTIVATALPAIAASLNGVEQISWVIVFYLIANTIAAPVYGYLGDTLGRRRLMFVALTIFIVASLLCALAPSMGLLALARVLQGFGGGGLMTLSQALIAEVIPPRERGRYQGYLGSVVVTSTALGPVAGGYLTQHFGWQAIFLMNLPAGLLAILLTLRLKARDSARQPLSFDAMGLVLFALFIGPALFAFQQIQRLRLETMPIIAALFGVAIVAVVMLIRHETRVTSPLLPMTLLRQPSIWRSDTLAALHGATFVSLVTFLPIYLYVTRGVTAGGTGLMLLPLMGGIGLGSLITGRLVSTTGRTTIFPSFGLAIASAGLFLLAARAPFLSTSQLAWLLGITALFLGTVMGVVQVTVLSASGPATLGAASASVMFSRSVGAAFGTAIVGTVLFSVLASADTQAAELFRSIVEHGPGSLAALPIDRQAALKAEIVDAFRAAFLTIAIFASMGLMFAWTIPMRRI